jgi:glycosyltransferase involved in cell wall biosynthesis
VSPLFGGPATGPFPSALARDGVPVLPVAFGPLRDLRGLAASTLRVRALIRRHCVDLVHANGPQTNVCAGLAGRLTGLPVIWHARNLIYGQMRDVDCMLAWLPARIICNSDAIRQRFARSRGWAKSVTILNAIDTREFSPAVPREPFRREVELAADEPAVGIVGRIGQGKGHATFVEAAIGLLGAGTQGQFLIVGDPLFEEDGWRTDVLRGRVKDAKLEGRIRFLGFREDVPRVMRGLDILVLASDAEPCGRVLFEAMASGTAIVATDTGGTPEIVRDGAEGLLVPPRDAAALADAIRRLLDDPALRRRLGQAGVARVQAEFTIERYVARTLEVYEDVLGSPGVR